MAARALSSATIAFGMVSIPVKLFTSAESGNDIRFNQIHEKDGSRLKQQLINANTGKPVPREEIVKGYEFAKGQYVLFSSEELKSIEAKATHSIDIVEFIPADLVPRIFMDRTYYLAPDKGASRAYSLLNAALVASGRAALAKYAARGKQYLVMVRPEADGLAMEQLKYASEIRDFAYIDAETAEVDQAELELALQLIEQRASERFEPDNYHDETRERMLAMIQQKVDGQEISVAPEEESEHKIIDMMEALKASLEASGSPSPRKRAAPKAAAKKPGRKRASSRRGAGKRGS